MPTPANGSDTYKQQIATIAGTSFNVLHYGAAGDGVADDTAELQAAFDAATVAGGTVFIPAGTYLVSNTGTITFNGTSHYYCLLIPSNIHIKMDPGAIIKLADGEDSAIFINSGISAAGNTDTWITGGTIDSNQANQSGAATGNLAGIELHNVTRFAIRDVKFINQYDYAMYALGLYDCYLENLWCTDAYGSGFHFGNNYDTDGVTARVQSSYFDNIKAEDTDGTPGPSAPGNPFNFTGDDSYVGHVEGRNNALGIKVQNATADCHFESLMGRDGTDVKIQGASENEVVRCSFGMISSSDSANPGVYIVYADDINIGSIISKNSTGPTIKYENCSEINADSIFSEDSEVDGINIASTAAHINIGKAIVKNASTESGNFSGLGINGASDVKIGSYTSIQDVTNARHAVRIYSGTDDVHIGTISAEGDYNNNSGAILQDEAATNIQLPSITIDGDPWFTHTGAVTEDLSLKGINHNLDSTGGAFSATVSDGTYLGQPLKIWMSADGGDVDVTVASHETSADEVFTFDTADSYLELEWAGAVWVTIKNYGVTV